LEHPDVCIMEATETHDDAVEELLSVHDHARRRVRDAGYGAVGAYQCDLCPAFWTL
jgi:hypothetical protein